MGRKSQDSSVEKSRVLNFQIFNIEAKASFVTPWVALIQNNMWKSLRLYK